MKKRKKQKSTQLRLFDSCGVALDPSNDIGNEPGKGQVVDFLSRLAEQKDSTNRLFRPHRSAHDAVKQASKYIQEGNCWVVNIDMAKYFDTIPHDRLMQRLIKGIGDKRLLRLINQYLKAGMMQGGLLEQRTKGSPQGGPLSPLLSNIVLDELDKELEKRGHKICRYADDCNIYVGSRKAGERVMESMIKYIECKLNHILKLGNAMGLNWFVEQGLRSLEHVVSRYDC